MKTSIWVEKWRPKRLDDVVFQDKRTRAFFKKIVEDKVVPVPLLMHGVQGTGKTTLSKVLVNELGIDKLDVLKLKCSDEKIEALREKATNFANTYALGQFKVVQLEEMDLLSLDAQGLLRSLIEDTQKNCWWVGTCNYPNKVIPPLRSRFQEVSFKAPNKDDIIVRMADILDMECVSYDPEELMRYVEVGYPDIRKTIQLLQQNTANGRLQSPTSSAAVDSDWKFGLLDRIVKDDFKGARKLVCESATREEHEDVFTFMYQNIDKMHMKDKDQAIVIIADYLYRHSLVADTEINLAAMFIELGKL